MNDQYRPPKRNGKSFLTGSVLNPQGIGRPRQHIDGAARSKAYRDRKKAASVTKLDLVEFPIVREGVRQTSPNPEQFTKRTAVRVHDCYEPSYVTTAGETRFCTKPKERCDCSATMSSVDAEALIASGAAEWVAVYRGHDVYDLRTGIVLKGGFTKRQEREAAEAQKIANPDENNTDPKAWEAALKAHDLAKNRGRLGKTGGLTSAILERLQYKADRRERGGRKTPDGTTPNWESLLPMSLSPALVEKIEFTKKIHRLSKATKQRRALTIDEIAHAMSCDVALIRQILKEKTQP